MNVTGASFALAIASLDVAKISSVLSLRVNVVMQCIAFCVQMHTDREEGQVQHAYSNVLPAANMFQTIVACNIYNTGTLYIQAL